MNVVPLTDHIVNSQFQIVSLGMSFDTDVLTIMYREPRCSSKTLSVGGLMKDRWRERRK